MNINIATTVRDLAVTMPGATRVFEKMGIDYCCGGNRTLADACVKAKVPVEEVTEFLAQAEQITQPVTTTPNWQTAPMSGLINHIVEKHHAFTKAELPRLEKLMNKVCEVHSDQHHELLELKAAFLNLKGEVEPHLLKEEQILFPYIIRLEAALNHLTKPPRAFFGTVKNPVRMMNIEHEAAGELLQAMREITQDYAVPATACISYQTLFQALIEFEADLHEHIHLENNLLFPRATQAEEKLTDAVRIIPQ